MTKDLQKQIEELEKEVEKYKLLWNSTGEDSVAIIAELEEENRVLKEKILKMRGSNDK